MGKLFEAGRRAFVGPKIILKTIDSGNPGDPFWIRPRKESQQTADEIRELRASFLRKGSNQEAYREYEDIIARLREQKIEPVNASPEDRRRMTELMVSVEMEPGYQTAVQRLHLRNCEHNFEDEKGPICGGERLDDATIEKLLEQMAPTAAEIAQIVEDWNGPLASGSEATSGMSPNGSSGGPSSPPTPNSPTSTESPAVASPQS